MQERRTIVERAIIWCLNAVTALLMTLLAVVIFSTVLARYVFRASVPELLVVTRFCIAWIVFIGGAIAVRNDDHLAIDIFGPYLSDRANRYRLLLVDILVTGAIVVFVLVGYRGFIVGLSRVERIPWRFAAGTVSLAYFNTAFFAGSVLMILFQLLNLVDRYVIRRPPSTKD